MLHFQISAAQCFLACHSQLQLVLLLASPEALSSRVNFEPHFNAPITPTSRTSPLPSLSLDFSPMIATPSIQVTCAKVCVYSLFEAVDQPYFSNR